MEGKRFTNYKECMHEREREREGEKERVCVSAISEFGGNKQLKRRALQSVHEKKGKGGNQGNEGIITSPCVDGSVQHHGNDQSFITSPIPNRHTYNTTHTHTHAHWKNVDDGNNICIP